MAINHTRVCFFYYLFIQAHVKRLDDQQERVVFLSCLYIINDYEQTLKNIIYIKKL